LPRVKLLTLMNKKKSGTTRELFTICIFVVPLSCDVLVIETVVKIIFYVCLKKSTICKKGTKCARLRGAIVCLEKFFK